MAIAPKKEESHINRACTISKMGKSDVIGHYVDEFDGKNILAKKQSHVTPCLVDFMCVIVSTPAMFFPRKPVSQIQNFSSIYINDMIIVLITSLFLHFVINCFLCF